MRFECEDLRHAWEHVRRKRGAGGYDGQDLAAFEQSLERRLEELLTELNEKRYLPDPALRVHIPKGDGRSRPLGLLNLRDKLAQAAVKPHLEQLFEPHFHNASYAYRPEKGHRKALARVQHELGQHRKWVAGADIADFFDSLDHTLLLKLVDQRIKDSWLRELIRMWLWIGVVERADVAESRAGVQQGGIISPLLANLYLNDFDHRLSREGIAFLRYADDFLLFCESRLAAEQALRMAEGWLRNDFHLKLNESKRELRSLEEGFSFLGIYFKGHRRYIDRRKVSKAVSTIFGWRPRARSLEQLLDKARASFRSWYQHYYMIEPEAVFRIYDHILGNEVSLFLQGAHRRDARRSMRADKEQLAKIPWLLSYRGESEAASWAERVMKFTREKLKQPDFRWVPFPKGAGQTAGSAASKGERSPESSFAGSFGPGIKPDHVQALERLQDKLQEQPGLERKPALPPQTAAPVTDKPIAEAKTDRASTAEMRSDEELRKKLGKRRKKVRRMFLGKRVLVVSRSGAMLRKQGERLLVTQGDEKLGSWPLADLKHVWILNERVTISGQALAACLGSALPLEICGAQGKVVGRLSGPDFPQMRHGARQGLLRAGAGGLDIAREMVEGKLKNQIKLLKFFKRSRRKGSLFRAAWKEQERSFNRLLDRVEALSLTRRTPEKGREELRALEAQGARMYWGVIRFVLPESVPFPGRVRKGAQDLVNSALNYGYGVLYNQVWRAILDAGLNPTISFLHEPFRAKPTLSFDLIEEFRAPMVDRVIFSLFSKEEPLRLEDGLLCPATRRLIVRNLLERWEQPTRYRSREEELGDIPRLQAEMLAEVVSGERKSYKSWAFQW